MNKSKQIWADEIPSVDAREMEDFFCACALHLGDPDTLTNNFGPLDIRGQTTYETNVAPHMKFNQFFRTYFKERQPDAFDFIRYMIWYERESRKLKSGIPPVQKTTSR